MKTNGPMSTEAVRRLLAGIEKGASDDERARRTARLEELPPSTRVATIVEAARDSSQLRRAAALAIAKVGGRGKEDALQAFLADKDHTTRWNAVSAIAVSPKMAADAVPALARLVDLELPRSRDIGALRDALKSLGEAGTAEALKVLLAIPADGFRSVEFRAEWLESLSRYRSPRAKRALAPFLKSKLVRERVPAIVGALRNGRNASRQELRAALDDRDFIEARNAARQCRNAIGTMLVLNSSQLEELKQWWDIESCPKMMSAAGIACFNGLTEADVGTWPSCLGKK